MQFFDAHKLAATIKQMALPAAKAQTEKAANAKKKPKEAAAQGNQTDVPGVASSKGMPKANSTEMPSQVSKPHGPTDFAHTHEKGAAASDKSKGKKKPSIQHSRKSSKNSNKANAKAERVIAPLSLKSGYKLVWEDDFDDEELDDDKWDVVKNCRETEEQCYTNKPWNVYLSEGLLNLHARVHTTGVEVNHCIGECVKTFYTSGRVQTTDDYTVKHGRIDVRAVMPDGDFLWPTIWMLPNDNAYGEWPLSGEIDILETTGNDPTTFSSTVHYGKDKFKSSGDQSLLRDTSDDALDLSEALHIYRLDWNSTHISTYIDNVPLLSMSMKSTLSKSIYGEKATGAPFDKPFHIAMNLAVGGALFENAEEELTTTKAEYWNAPYMQIDWVRVYQKMTKSELKQALSVADESNAKPKSKQSSTRSNNDVINDARKKQQQKKNQHKRRRRRRHKKLSNLTP